MGSPGRRQAAACLAGLVVATLLALPRTGYGQVETPPDFTVAFIGDQGLGPDSRAVLTLIRDEGADAVVHQGDFDYEDDPDAWMAQIDDVLGPDFPYFASVGNHDTDFYFARGGYLELLEERLTRQGIPWSGTLGVRSSLRYRGLFILMTAPGVWTPLGLFFDDYIRDELAADDSIWRISSWHKNQTRMQVGNKANATGWSVYEASRRGGAIIATGHEHSYSRTHLLANVRRQVVASTDEPLVLTSDDPDTPADEGRSFVFVSGLGGRSIRDQERGGPWWASIYTEDQGANHGALFGVFHYQGDPRLAYFYFKDIDGFVPDAFLVRSTVASAPGDDWDGDGIPDDGDASGVVGDRPCATGEKVGCDDNCRYAPNPDQRDAGGLAASLPDGIGDVCQCGDVRPDGLVDRSDLHLLALWLWNDDAAEGRGFDASRCNLGGRRRCNGADLLRLRHALDAGTPPRQLCAAAQP
jgi:hypothetical protein